MVPPQNYSSLCEIPPPLLEAVEQKEANHNTTTIQPPLLSTPTHTPWRFPGSVSLLVSLGGSNSDEKDDCHPVQKVQVALWLHQHVSQDLKFVVFYNNDGSDPDAIVTLDMSLLPTSTNNVVLDENKENTTDYTNTTTSPEDLQQLLKDSGMVRIDKKSTEMHLSCHACVFLTISLHFCPFCCTDLCLGEHWNGHFVARPHGSTGFIDRNQPRICQSDSSKRFQ